MFSIDPPEIRNLINIQLRSILAYCAFSCIILSIGFILLFHSDTINGSNDIVKKVINIGGGFITTLTTFPMKYILACHNRMSMLRLAQMKLSQLQTSNLSKREKEKDKADIMALIEEIVSKSI